MTPLMAGPLALIVDRMASPFAPPPAAATAWAASFGGMAAGLGYAASLVNRAGLAWITASSGANFCALASCVLYCVAVATTCGWPCANAISLWYWVAYADTVDP